VTGTIQSVEIVGVAGSGKSTVTRVLRSKYGCHVADTLHTKLPGHWPYVVHGLPRIAPFVVASIRDRPMLSWDELKFVLYVMEWDRFLRAQYRDRPGVVVLDQGPMFALARLLWGRKPATRHPSFEVWLRRMAGHWSHELDAIVLLDAPDAVLLRRIDTRQQRHDAKGVPSHEGLELLGRHREAYERVVEIVESLGGTRVLRYDTATMPSARIAGKIVEQFEPSAPEELTEPSGALNVRQGRATREDA
jgi:shikimate kinase